MSDNYECKISHWIKDGETTITIKARIGPPYKGDMAITVRRAKNSESAVLRALKSYI